jgi:hypothetical protein
MDSNAHCESSRNINALESKTRAPDSGPPGIAALYAGANLVPSSRQDRMIDVLGMCRGNRNEKGEGEFDAARRRRGRSRRERSNQRCR